MRTRITNAQKTKLSFWLSSNFDKYSSGQFTMKKLCDELTRELGFKVASQQVKASLADLVEINAIDYKPNFTITRNRKGITVDNTSKIARISKVLLDLVSVARELDPNVVSDDDVEFLTKVYHRNSPL